MKPSFYHISHHISFLFLFSCCFTASQANEMTGMYSYMADAGLFLECGQTKRLPVAMEGDNISLERAYLKNRYMPGKSLLVTFNGHIAMRPKMEDNELEETIIVEEFISIKQQERCTGVVPPSSLGNTYWKLVELDGQRLDENESWLKMRQENSGASRDIHFVIRENDLLTGFSGCNKFSGRITSDETTIQIGPLRSTRMACPAMEVESTFHKSLEKADHYSIKGESLELFQKTMDSNKSIAKFIAIYF
ncbi:MAG: META domain-containing protein [Gammaproteobacteria bacterium]|nr:META domain-containing protein [Gammaproteobacteria bacterium]